MKLKFSPQILVPGVIDSTTNFIEHPRLVARRLREFAGLVGRDRLVAVTLLSNKKM